MCVTPSGTSTSNREPMGQQELQYQEYSPLSSWQMLLTEYDLPALKLTQRHLGGIPSWTDQQWPWEWSTLSDSGSLRSASVLPPFPLFCTCLFSSAFAFIRSQRCQCHALELSELCTHPNSFFVNCPVSGFLLEQQEAV